MGANVVIFHREGTKPPCRNIPWKNLGECSVAGNCTLPLTRSVSHSAQVKTPMGRVAPKQSSKAVIARTYVADKAVRRDLHSIVHAGDKHPKPGNKFADPTFSYSAEAEKVLELAAKDPGLMMYPDVYAAYMGV
jgi:hypothetical protein